MKARDQRANAGTYELADLEAGPLKRFEDSDVRHPPHRAGAEDDADRTIGPTTEAGQG